MDPYTFALTLGGVGLVAMATTGMVHPGGPGARHGAGATGHRGGGGHGNAGAGAAHGHTGPAHSSHPAVRGTSHGAGALRSAMLALASPHILFSLLVGFGVTGVVARAWLGGAALACVAAVGAVAFERLVVNPLWQFLFRFASRPASTLEDSLMREARATSGFDERGQGLVAIEVDGQVVQCLGTLGADDLALGIRVRSGDVLRVEHVDPSRNRCSVSYVRHSTNP